MVEIAFLFRPNLAKVIVFKFGVSYHIKFQQFGFVQEYDSKINLLYEKSSLNKFRCLGFQDWYQNLDSEFLNSFKEIWWKIFC